MSQPQVVYALCQFDDHVPYPVSVHASLERAVARAQACADEKIAAWVHDIATGDARDPARIERLCTGLPTLRAERDALGDLEKWQEGRYEDRGGKRRYRMGDTHLEFEIVAFNLD